MSAGNSPDKAMPSKDSNEDEKLAAKADAAAQGTPAGDAEEQKPKEPSLDDTAAEAPGRVRT